MRPFAACCQNWIPIHPTWRQMSSANWTIAHGDVIAVSVLNWSYRTSALMWFLSWMMERRIKPVSLRVTSLLQSTKRICVVRICNQPSTAYAVKPVAKWRLPLNTKTEKYQNSSWSVISSRLRVCSAGPWIRIMVTSRLPISHVKARTNCLSKSNICKAIMRGR